MKSLKQKADLKAVYRTPPDTTDRLQYTRLDKNECALHLPRHILQEIRQSITPEFLGCYPEVYKLYQALSSFHAIPEDNILVTAGSDGAIRAAYDAFVNPNDDVINIQPNFAMYDVYTRLCEANPVDIYYDPRSLTLNIEDVTRRIRDNTALIVLSNPNSPTGVEISLGALESIVKKAEEQGTRVIVDEAYYPFSANTSVNLLREFKNLIILQTFSKAFGLAGLRAGYALSSRENIELMGKFRPMYEVNTLAVLCSCIYLKNYHEIKDSVKETLAVKDWFVNQTESLGFSVIPGSSNFVNIIVGKTHVQYLVNHFKDKRILIRPGYPWGILDECIRISLGNKTEMAAVLNVLAGWKDDSK